jgi:hypothetical protein
VGALTAALAGCGGDDPGLTAAQRAEVARRTAAEAPHHRSLAPGTPRAALLADLRRTVLADARARRARGELRGRPFRGARCVLASDDVAYARRRRAAPVLRYSCMAYTIRVMTRPPQIIGQPFVARVDFPAARYAWCEFTPVGGEGAHTAVTFAVEPSPECVAR